MARFETLPPELIAQVASLTDVKTILSLSQTSKVLRRASYDAVVLKKLFIETQHPSNTTDVATFEAVTDGDPETWARYTLAIEFDAKMLTPGLKKTMKLGRASVWAWSPPVYVVSLFIPKVWSAQTEHHDEPKNVSPEERNETFMFGVISAAYTGQQDARPGDVFPPSVRSGSASTSFQELCGYLSGCRYSNQDRDLVYKSSGVPSSPLIPQATLTPSFQPPRPFDGDAAWSSWHKSQTEAMLAEEIALPSEWSGLYSISAGSRSTRSGGCHLTNIQFKFEGPNEADIGALAGKQKLDVSVEARGIKDEALRNTADLQLSGRFVEIPTGDICLRASLKEPNQLGAERVLECYLTPLGLVGVWEESCGLTGQLNARGSVWLWKKKWTE